MNFNLDIYIQTAIALIAVISAIYAMMKFLLKDIYIKLIAIDKHILEIKEDQKKVDQRVLETNKRMDGVYNVLLNKNN